MKNNFKLLKKSFCKNLVVLLSALFLFNCSASKIDVIDREAGLTRSDLKNALIANKRKKNKKESAQEAESVPIPKISRMLSLPAPPQVGGGKLISFSVTEQVPLKDVLIELGRVTNIDVDVDPAISGGIIVNAKDRPLEEVIDRIVERGNLRYSYKNDVLFFERDLPYVKHYTVSYLIDGSLWAEVETGIDSIASGNFDSSIDPAITSYSITANKSAGIITVFANSKKHKEIKKYLKTVKRTASAQVLIEAKIVEVALNDTYKTGIDWKFGSTQGISVPLGLNDNSVFAATITAAGKALDGTTKGRIIATLSALEEFGDVRAIASPRINALNNQKATLDFANKLVYFSIAVQTDTTTLTTGTTGSVSQTTLQGTREEADIGVQLNITPSIDIQSNEITLQVNPIISIQSGTAVDPTTFIDSDGNAAVTGNTVPIIQTRELNSTMKIQDGGILVIGGLMQEDTTNIDTGIPFLSRIPILGHLFKKVSKVTTIKETVIFIKATIIRSDDEIEEFDRDFHDTFTSSKRKFF